MTETIGEVCDNKMPNSFWLALGLNFIWINLSEVVRYFGLVKPMLNEAYPGADHIAEVTPTIFASWMLWDTILIFGAVGLYWMYLRQYGANLQSAIKVSLYFTTTVFGLIWIGIVNMGFVGAEFIWVAVPLAWLEQFIAAVIVVFIMRRGQPAEHIG